MFSIMRYMMVAVIAIAGLLSFTLHSFAGFQGRKPFIGPELYSIRKYHEENIAKLIETTIQCLKEDLEHHRRHFGDYKISPYYGENSKFSKLSPEKQLREVRSNVSTKYKNKAREILSKMEPTSCIGLVLKCLKAGFIKTNQEHIWREVRSYVRSNNNDGTSLQDALQILGWRIYYYNPDVAKSVDWDREERGADRANKERFWGYHSYRLSTVNSKNKNYYNNTVDDISALVNFGPVSPKKLSDIPLFVGTAHTGWHVFPGVYGKIIEAHSTRSISDKKTVEESDFNPIGGGGPNGAFSGMTYRSGLIAIPPGFLMK